MIIFRYISKELCANLLAITLVLLIIFITNQFVHYLREAASGAITMTTVLKIMSLQVPILLGYLLPLGLFLAILLAFGRICTDHEMTVLFACGMSRAKLYGMTLVVAFLLTVVVAFLMLWLEPVVQQYRTRILDEAVAKASIDKLVPRRFQSFGKKGVFYAERISRKNHAMYEVFLAKYKGIGGQFKQNAWDITVASSAKELSGSALNGQYVVFNNGYHYVGAPGYKKFQIARYKEYGVKLQQASGHLNDWPQNATTLSLWHERKTNSRAAAALQWRLALPISVIVLALLALPLSLVDPRRGKFSHFFPAALIYFVYADLMFLGRAWIGKGKISPSLGLWWIHALALLLAIALITRQMKRRSH